MDKKFLRLADIDAYVLSYHLSNKIWEVVIQWDWFAKQTVGAQYITAIDSISANIAEGFGRYHKKDKIKFYRYAIGSLKESQDWTQKSYSRKLISKKMYQETHGTLIQITKEIYSLINYTDIKLAE